MLPEIVVVLLFTSDAAPPVLILPAREALSASVVPVVAYPLNVAAGKETDPSLKTLNGAVALLAPAHITIFASAPDEEGYPIPVSYPVPDTVIYPAESNLTVFVPVV